jgi:hypothetical protein
MVEQNGFDNAFTTDEYRRLRQRLDEDAIRNLTLCYSHYLHHRYCERLRGVFTPDIVCEFGPNVSSTSISPAIFPATCCHEGFYFRGDHLIGSVSKLRPNKLG